MTGAWTTAAGRCAVRALTTRNPIPLTNSAALTTNSQ
jgi:hypothetical protein